MFFLKKLSKTAFFTNSGNINNLIVEESLLQNDIHFNQYNIRIIENYDLLVYLVLVSFYRSSTFWGLFLGLLSLVTSRVWFVSFMPTWWSNQTNSAVIALATIVTMDQILSGLEHANANVNYIFLTTLVHVAYFQWYI